MLVYGSDLYRYYLGGRFGNNGDLKGTDQAKLTTFASPHRTLPIKSINDNKVVHAAPYPGAAK